MQKRSSNRKANDVNEIAFRVVSEATAKDRAEKDEGKNPAAVALGRLGGKVGGKARADKLTQERRKEIAEKAAQARWQKG